MLTCRPNETYKKKLIFSLRLDVRITDTNAKEGEKG